MSVQGAEGGHQIQPFDTRSAPGLFKEVADGHAEETRRFPKPGRGDAIGAALVFLDLLEREPERLTEVALAESQTAPAMSDPEG